MLLIFLDMSKDMLAFIFLKYAKDELIDHHLDDVIGACR